MSSSEQILPLFVYGTLRHGEKNYHRYLGGRTIHELSATLEGGLFFVDGEGYPYLLGNGGGRVVGELMVIDPARYQETLQEVDRLEEYDRFDEAGSVYLRRAVTVTLDGGQPAQAWVYYWNGPADAGRGIASGDFRDR